MPVTPATTLHVYVAVFAEDVGPVTEEQVVMPVTPVIAQVPAPVGADAPVGPATVALNVMVEPSVAVAAFATTVTVGVAALTFVVEPDAGEVAR